MTTRLPGEEHHAHQISRGRDRPRRRFRRDRRVDGQRPHPRHQGRRRGRLQPAAAGHLNSLENQIAWAGAHCSDYLR
ncbi:hypothetical protein LT493_10550 [Streptomyces tricolor]|nr:hypothetical protein [Streptomyces tricolor]